MDKRRAEVTPLKKISYTAQEESNWWESGCEAVIYQKKLDLLYNQMEEYKKLTEEAEEHKNRIIGVKVEELLAHVEHPQDIVQKVKESILQCQEHILTISQLRKRLQKKTEQPPTLPPTLPSTLPPTLPSTLPTEDLHLHILKIEQLENRIDTALSKHPPNYTHLLKSLETENSELSSTNQQLSKRVEDELIKSQTLEQATARLSKELQQQIQALQHEIQNREEEKHILTQEKAILQQRVDELYLGIEKINSDMIDYSRELEKENHSLNCTPECTKRIRELEGKEIDRVEEVSFLVRKYIDTSKRNDELLLQMQQEKKEALALPKHSTDDLEEKHLKECHSLHLELEKSKLEYLERKSSAQYHKRKAVQYESELKASRKTAKDLEQVNAQLQSKLEHLKESKAPQQPPKENELELYQKMVRCAICCTNIKDAILKKCMHLMCMECIKSRHSMRQRTCPLCGVVFSMTDVSHVYL